MLQRRGRMKKKICPVCDSELLSGNYCRICKKIVWEPRYENRNFNLNESRRSKPAFYDADEARTPKEPPPVVKKLRPGPLYQPSSKKNPLPVSVVMTTIAAAFCLFVWISVKINMTGQGISGDIFSGRSGLRRKNCGRTGISGSIRRSKSAKRRQNQPGQPAAGICIPALRPKLPKKQWKSFWPAMKHRWYRRNYLYDDNYFVWVEANLRDENYAKSECAPE